MPADKRACKFYEGSGVDGSGGLPCGQGRINPITGKPVGCGYNWVAHYGEPPPKNKPQPKTKTSASKGGRR